jgi:putative membrane protein
MMIGTSCIKNVLVTRAERTTMKKALIRFIIRKKRDRALNGMIAGLVGGLVGSYVMTQFQETCRKIQAQSDTNEHNKQPSEGLRKDEPATVKLASAISENVLDQQLGKEQRERAGTAMHYLMGAASGAAYGAVAELLPRASAANGLMFGAALWLVADEIATPALGLSGPPSDHPLSTHAGSLASHLVYAVTTDLTRKATLRGLKSIR